MIVCGQGEGMQIRCEIWNSLKMVGKYGSVRTYLQDSASVIK